MKKNWKFGKLKTSSGLIIMKIKIKIEMDISKIFIYKNLFEIFHKGGKQNGTKLRLLLSL